MVICRLVMRCSAPPDQLRTLAEELERWCDFELDEGECFVEIEESCLKDLRAGELPLPRFLAMTKMLHLPKKLTQILGEEFVAAMDIDVELEEGQVSKTSLESLRPGAAF